MPQRGSVVRYSYLWAREHRRGQIEGLKDRPTLVLSLSIRVENNRTRVLVVPVTHARPANPADGVEIPAAVKRQLGLDREPAWIVTTESNTFTWPGPDLRPIPEKPAGTFIYGQVPDGLLREVTECFIRNKERGAIVPRDET
ncbi:MAG: hypothetical protein JSR60_16155 [Proteobacteria bacterium]|nr:hypothetical protein [Pseudomonadota bacterium]